MRIPGIPYVQGRNDYTDWDGSKYGIAIHNTSNDASDEGEASYATRRTDGVSAHLYADHDSVTQSLDLEDRAGHAGSVEGNDHSIAVEITGANGKPRSWWLANVAWDKLGQVLAWIITHDPDYAGFEVRRATVAEMRANPRVKAFYGHNDMRLAWGGTDHTDPGPHFPWDRLVDAVNTYLEEDDMPTAQEIARAVRAELTVVTTEQHWSVKSGLHRAGRTLDPATGIELSWGYAKDIWRQLPELASAADLAELRGQVAGLTTLVQQVLAGGPAPLTSEQLEQLTAAVTAAAREPGERIAAQLAAAGRAVADLDDEPA